MARRSVRGDPDQKIEAASAGRLRCIVGRQQTEQAGEERHGEVHRIDLRRSVSDGVDEHQPHRVVTDIVTLRDLGPELPGAQVADQPAAESTLRPQDGIDDGAEHRLERDSLFAGEECRSRDATLLDEEQLAQDLVLAGEVHVEGAAGHTDALGDRRDLGFGETASLELLDRLVEQPGPSGFALGRAKRRRPVVRGAPRTPPGAGTARD